MRIAFTLGLLVLLHCGNRPATFTTMPPTGDVDAAAPDLDARIDPNDADIMECKKGFQCSGDLHDVLDACGNLVQSCAASDACNPNGTCVPACDGARANKSSIGCDYYTFTPPPYAYNVQKMQYGHMGCFVAFVVNTWTTAVSIAVERGGKKYNPADFTYVPNGTGASITYTKLAGPLPAGSVAMVFLSQPSTNFGTTMCPKGVMTAETRAEVYETTYADAFRVTTDLPITAYDMYPYGGGASAVSSATLLLPVSAWDVNYMTASPFPYTVQTSYPWLAIVAQEDNTDVNIVPVVDIAAQNGVQATSAFTKGTYHLSRGQMVKFEQKADLSGSPIDSNKPIAVWGGNAATQLPLGVGAADGMHQQIPPVRALGIEYVAVRHRDRVANMTEQPPWRFVGVVDGTKLVYEPPQNGAPTTLDMGEVVEWEAPGPYVVRSQDAQHPFYFAAHMKGCSAIGGNMGPLGCAGDPETVNVIPPAQYLKQYTFFTDPTYPETNLVFVRKQANNNFQDVQLDCVGTIGGWQSIGASEYQYTRVDLVRHDFLKEGNCDNGRHVAKSTVPFALTVWGWGTNESTLFSEAVSYAYPAGANVQPITSVVVPATPK